MLPKVIEYKVDGNLLIPLIYLDLDLLFEHYDSIMVNVKQVRRRRKR